MIISRTSKGFGVKVNNYKKGEKFSSHNETAVSIGKYFSNKMFEIFYDHFMKGSVSKATV